MTKKKIARKIATYAMAASMIGGSILGSGITGVSAAEKYPTAKTSYSKTVADTDYKQAYLDYISQFIKAPEITSATAKTVWGYILSTYDETIIRYSLAGTKILQKIQKLDSLQLQ